MNIATDIGVPTILSFALTQATTSPALAVAAATDASPGACCHQKSGRAGPHAEIFEAMAALHGSAGGAHRRRASQRQKSGRSPALLLPAIFESLRSVCLVVSGPVWLRLTAGSLDRSPQERFASAGRKSVRGGAGPDCLRPDDLRYPTPGPACGPCSHPRSPSFMYGPSQSGVGYVVGCTRCHRSSAVEGSSGTSLIIPIHIHFPDGEDLQFMTLQAVEHLILDSDHEMVWELFHENSKMSFVDPHPVYRLWPSDASIAAAMSMLHRVKQYRRLPEDRPPSGMARRARRSGRCDRPATDRPGIRS